MYVNAKSCGFHTRPVSTVTTTTDQCFSILSSTIRWFPTADPAIRSHSFEPSSKLLGRTTTTNIQNIQNAYKRKRNIETKNKTKFQHFLLTATRRNARERDLRGASEAIPEMAEWKKRALPRWQTFVERVVLDSHRQHREKHNLREGRR